MSEGWSPNGDDFGDDFGKGRGVGGRGGLTEGMSTDFNTDGECSGNEGVASNEIIGVSQMSDGFGIIMAGRDGVEGMMLSQGMTGFEVDNQWEDGVKGVPVGWAVDVTTEAAYSEGTGRQTVEDTQQGFVYPAPGGSLRAPIMPSPIPAGSTGLRGPPVVPRLSPGASDEDNAIYVWPQTAPANDLGYYQYNYPFGPNNLQYPYTGTVNQYLTQEPWEVQNRQLVGTPDHASLEYSRLNLDIPEVYAAMMRHHHQPGQDTREVPENRNDTFVQWGDECRVIDEHYGRGTFQQATGNSSPQQMDFPTYSYPLPITYSYRENTPKEQPSILSRWAALMKC